MCVCAGTHMLPHMSLQAGSDVCVCVCVCVCVREHNHTTKLHLSESSWALFGTTISFILLTFPPSKCLYFKQPLKTGNAEGYDNPLRVEKEMENRRMQTSGFLAGS